MSASNGKHNGKKTPGDKNKPAPAALTIRPARQSDGVPLSFFFDTALRKDYFMRRGQLADMLESPYHQVYVAEIDAILVGVAITTRGTRLVNALVHPGYRGLGIGQALVRCSGATEVRVKRDMQDGDPRGFYASLGFKSTGDTNQKGNIEVMRLRKKRGQSIRSRRTRKSRGLQPARCRVG
ncbi:MAG: GNAT family N-acetyltransferase [Phycisphaerae bacterium]|nr:GNAT family N-acetyltransferase [Phycisphaerae bacterium]